MPEYEVLDKMDHVLGKQTARNTREAAFNMYLELMGRIVASDDLEQMLPAYVFVVAPGSRTHRARYQLIDADPRDAGSLKIKKASGALDKDEDFQRRLANAENFCKQQSACQAPCKKMGATCLLDDEDRVYDIPMMEEFVAIDPVEERFKIPRAMVLARVYEDIELFRKAGVFRHL